MMTTCLMRYLLDGNACFPQSLAICVAIFVRLHDIIIRTTANSQGQQNHYRANKQSFHFQFFLEERETFRQSKATFDDVTPDMRTSFSPLRNSTSNGISTNAESVVATDA